MQMYEVHNNGRDYNGVPDRRRICVSIVRLDRRQMALGMKCLSSVRRRTDLPGKSSDQEVLLYNGFDHSDRSTIQNNPLYIAETTGNDILTIRR